jgi:preprotein translocase subunit SecD
LPTRSSAHGIPSDAVGLEGSGDSASVRARFATPDIQFKAKLALERDLNRDPADPDYIVTVNLSRTRRPGCRPSMPSR